MIQLKFSRKGITPVIATAILITISIAATGTAYTVLTDTQKEVQEGFEKDISDKKCKSQSDLNLEYVYNSTGGFIFTNLRNSGSISTPINESGRKILTFYADGTPVSSNVGSGGKGWKYTDLDSRDLSEEQYLDPNEIITINTTVEFPPETGDSKKEIKVVGACEATDSHVCYNTGTASC